MHVSTLSTALALWATSVSAFYPYVYKGHKGAAHKVHISNQISKGFAFGGKGKTDDTAGLVKVPITKRAINKRGNKKLWKRVNDFQIEKAEQPSAENSAGLSQDGTDFSYFSEITFGTEPGETMYMLMDTGSSSTWVMGAKCKTIACTTHSTFGESDSKTLKTTSDTFDIGYNTGEVNGSIVTDTVSIAGISVQMSFGQADITSDDFDNYPMDGIMGLGRDSRGSGLDAPTFMQVLQKEKALKANVIGVHLNRHSDGNADGVITFGGTDDSKYVGDINYMSTTGDIRDWQIAADDIEVDGKAIGVNGRDAIIDTGTSYMFIAPDDAKKLFAKIDGSMLVDDDNGIYHVPCDAKTSVALVFNKVAYSIDPKDYVGLEDGDSNMCLAHIIGQSNIDDKGTWLIGDTFLKNVYSVFDMDESRVGFASKEETDSPDSSSSKPSSSSSSTSSSKGTSSSSSSSLSAEETSGSSSSGSSTSKEASTSAPASASASATDSASETATITSSTSSADMGLTRPTGSGSDSSVAEAASETPSPTGSGQEGAAARSSHISILSILAAAAIACLV